MDIFSKEKRSEIMSRVKNKDSKIEIAFRKALWREGFRYRKNVKSYFGKPDLVLKKYNTIIFVDSCFWHGCKKHAKLPVTNKTFWKNKIENNKKRDKIVNKYYKKNSWKIYRIWSHSMNSRYISKFIKRSLPN